MCGDVACNWFKLLRAYLAHFVVKQFQCLCRKLLLCISGLQNIRNIGIIVTVVLEWGNQ